MGGPPAGAWALLALLPSLGGCLSQAGGPAGDGALGVGDSWTLRSTYVEGGTFAYTLRETVAKVETKAGEHAYKVTGRLEPDTPPEHGGTAEHRETSWLRVTDLAVLETLRVNEGEIPPEGDRGARQFRETSRTVFDPPCAGAVGRPLTAGLAWTVSCPATRTTLEWTSDGGDDWHNGTQNQTTRYVVAGLETVTTAAGTFSAHRVEWTATSQGGTRSWGTAWVAPDLCVPHPVKATSAYENDEHAGESTSELADVRC